MPEILILVALFLAFGVPLLCIGLVVWLVHRSNRKKKEEEQPGR